MELESHAEQSRGAAAAVGATAERAGTPGRPLLRRARSLVLWASGAAILYSSLVASKGSCPGGFTADGGYLDAAGDPTTVQPQCVQLTLHPSPVGYLAIVLTVIIALSRAARAVDVEIALRTMNRGAIVAVSIAVVSMLVAILWFQGSPMPTVGGTVLFPFPFGSGTMTVTPMEPGPAG
ncbi:hypothetical protein ACFVWR_07725 [Leifsonia sp. NPDC058292]|uniref:hypothetical protein n=1 Tax=Leifsonia sp. NPDC058292 TaxID=3346428 RepID=UPI0036DED752